MYALTTQTSVVSVKRRSSRIEGSATFTIVVSSTIISTPVHNTISAHHLRRSSSFVISFPCRPAPERGPCIHDERDGASSTARNGVRPHSSGSLGQEWGLTPFLGA